MASNVVGQGGFSSLGRENMEVINRSGELASSWSFSPVLEVTMMVVKDGKSLLNPNMKSRDCIVVTASSEKLTKQEKGYSLSNILMFSFMLSKPDMWAMPSSLDRYSVQGGQAAVAL